MTEFNVWAMATRTQQAEPLPIAHYLVRINHEVRVTAWQLLQTWGLGTGALDLNTRNILHHAAIQGSVNDTFLHHAKYCLHVDFELRDSYGKTALEYAFTKSQQRTEPRRFWGRRWKHAVAAFTRFFTEQAAVIDPQETEPMDMSNSKRLK